MDDASGRMYWICGSVCAGKTSIARMLTEQHGGVAYHFDSHERDHIRRLGPSSALSAFPDNAATQAEFDRAWLHPSPSDLVLRAVSAWRERFPLVLEDVDALNNQTVIAEGVGLFPNLVAPLLPAKHHGICLVGTPDFIRWARSHRGMTLPGLTSDPVRTFENIIERDVAIADMIRAEAKAAGMRVLTVTGTQSAEQTARTVAAHFEFGRERAR